MAQCRWHCTRSSHSAAAAGAVAVNSADVGLSVTVFTFFSIL